VLALRHAVNRIIREEMEARGFLEVETPLLGRSTPEGARDFMVPSRPVAGDVLRAPAVAAAAQAAADGGGTGPVLPDRPVPADEQPRADRSFEFTQLDVEMSFVDEEDVIAVIEPLYARIVREIQGVEVPTPFPRMNLSTR
jgi:aspartyl-tRNA synthetase